MSYDFSSLYVVTLEALTEIKNGPSAWALDAESPTSNNAKKKKKEKTCWSRDRFLFLRSCTIFCMREAVTIFDGSRILPCPLGLQNDLKTMICFWTFLYILEILYILNLIEHRSYIYIYEMRYLDHLGRFVA